MKRRSLSCLLLACCCFLAAFPLASQERRGRISWRSVRGAAFYRVEIRGESGNYVVNQVTAATSLSFPIEPGDYQLRISALNRKREAETSTEWTPLAVRRRGNPEISGVSPEQVPEKGGEAEIVVRGRRFAANATVSLRDGSRELPLRIVSVEPERIRLALAAGTRRRGSYDLRVMNPGEPAADKDGALQVGEDVDGFLGLGLFLGYGNNVDIVLGDWSQKVGGSSPRVSWIPEGGGAERKEWGHNLYAAYNLHPRFGVELSLGCRFYPPEPGSYLEEFHLTQFWAGAYYRLPFLGYLELLPRFDIGLAMTRVKLVNAGESYTSGDFLFRLGAGLRAHLLWRDLFLEIAPELHVQTMAGPWFSTLGFSFRAGFIL